MTIKMFLAAVGTVALLSGGVAVAQTAAPAAKPAATAAKLKAARAGEVAGMLQAGRRQGPARQGAQEVPLRVQEGLTRLSTKRDLLLKQQAPPGFPAARCCARPRAGPAAPG